MGGWRELFFTLSKEVPASARIALMFSHDAAVWTAMEPVTTWPSGEPGIWPDTKSREEEAGIWIAWVWDL